MRLEVLKSERVTSECPLDGVRVAEIRNNQYAMSSITLVDAAGHTMVVEGAEYSGSVRVLVKAPPQKVKKYVLAGRVFTGSIGLEVAVNETFDSQADAVNRKQALEQHGAELTITETEAEVPGGD